MSNNTLTKEAQQDVAELKNKIEQFKSGDIPEERFKAYRLTRGVYGQRQHGVQMFRIKLPYGKITPHQLRTIGDISQQYSNGNIHLTTRQNIQLHYVKLDDSPAIWEQLESVGVTARESCGNTVRNITASPFAGVDPEEPFDVSPYVQASFEYFLRNPVCQDMGRKIKMAFSSSEKDTALTFIHDLGFIPRIKDGRKGFKVLIGGGLGAQPFIAPTAVEFLPDDELIPFTEAALRVFDRHGERENRNKARLKYLIEPRKGVGLEKFLELVDEERKSLPFQSYPIDVQQSDTPSSLIKHKVAFPEDSEAFEQWKATNVFRQKQEGFFGVKVRIPLGNLSLELAYRIAQIAEEFASNDIRITVNQGLLFRYVEESALGNIYEQLKLLGLNLSGFDSLADITSCPGTDTCNLGVTNSTHLATELEEVIRSEYPHLVGESSIKIKISGCMNSCGQHMIANIGFHGSSIKSDGKVAPAMQVVLGGGLSPDGKGFIAEKVIKVPTKRTPQVLKLILDDYESNQVEGEYFNDYFRRTGKKYFYGLLKPIVDEAFGEDDFVDWGRESSYQPEIGVGECAGVMVDLVGTVVNDAEEQLSKSSQALLDEEWAHAIFHAYNTFIIGAKAILLEHDIECNTHQKIIRDFDELLQESQIIGIDGSFTAQVLKINKHEPSRPFAKEYVGEATQFLEKIQAHRAKESLTENVNKSVIINHYKA